MKLTRPPRRTDSEPVLPLVNVVFLLLIFFLISGVLAESPPFPVSPPEVSERAQEDEARHLRLYLAADGRLALGNEVLSREEVLSRLAEKERAAPLDLVADAQADARAVVALMRALRGAGREHIRLIVSEGAG